MNGLLVVYLQDNEGGPAEAIVPTTSFSNPRRSSQYGSGESACDFSSDQLFKREKTPFEDPETHPPYDESRNKSKFMFRDTRNLPNPSRLVYYTLHR